MEYSKLQIGCLLIVFYIAAIYIREKRAYKISKKETIFEALIIAGILSIIFDAVTAYTVNHLNEVPDFLNDLLHMCFLISLDVIMFLIFLYVLDLVKGVPSSRFRQLLIALPLIVNIIIVISFIPQLEYRYGSITNYSMGMSAYTCFAVVTIYILVTVAVLLRGWREIERHKRVTIATCVVVISVVTIYQMLNPQALISCIAPTFAIIGMYLNVENPVFTKLKTYNQEMVMGFSTLVENRDENTGGHIRRTTEYVEVLARELKRRGYYSIQLTEDYIKNLVTAAPMHDIGKIAIPDAVLQKPGRLTPEEFGIMKTHSERGGRIIQETFRNTGDDEYFKMAYEVAMYHHEKWNGKGYPRGLSEKEIPLSARIMAVADVFDAVSAKRCYRDAMPLDKCFEIIKEGGGQDFDPVIAEVFLDIREKIENIQKTAFE